MRITRVYTRSGDRGTTALVGGQRVPKDHVRIEAYGTVDELNAVLGLARAELARCPDPAAVAPVDAQLEQAQHDCFSLGSDLATRTEDRWPQMRLLGPDDITRMEGWIDTLNADLEPLQEFVLPGGGPSGATLHLARTVCRRAERATIRLAASEDVNVHAIAALNRLSDYLFVASRWVARQLGQPEPLWDRTR